MLGMALVPETRALFGDMSVEDNLLLGALPPVAPRPRRRAARSLDDVFALFPRLKERRAQLAGTLSGGERQMLAVGRALMGKPRAADARRAEPRPRAAGGARHLQDHRRRCARPA